MTELSTETVTEEVAGAEDATLLTGDPREPDKGPGEREPDKGPGEKDPTQAESEADEAEGDQTDSEEETEEVEGAPEAYEDFTVAEGVELNSELLDEFKATAKETNLSQANAQKFVDVAVKLQESFVKAQADAIVEVRGQWLESTKTDKEIGGDKLPETLATAKRALEAFGTPELRELLDQTGLGNHPEVIRVLAKAGETVAEDKVVTGKTRPNTPQSIAERLYPSNKE